MPENPRPPWKWVALVSYTVGVAPVIIVLIMGRTHLPSTVLYGMLAMMLIGFAAYLMARRSSGRRVEGLALRSAFGLTIIVLAACVCLAALAVGLTRPGESAVANVWRGVQPALVLAAAPAAMFLLEWALRRPRREATRDV